MDMVMHITILTTEILMETDMDITKGLEMEYMHLTETTEITTTPQGITEEEGVEELEQGLHPLMEIEDQILEQVIRQELLKTQIPSQEDNL
jgi:hypothetical protein